MSIIDEEPRVAREHRKRARVKRGTSLLAQGEPMVWLSGGALAIALIMIAGLLGWILYKGGSTFLVEPIVRLEATDGRAWIGEVTRDERYTPGPDVLERLEPALRAAVEEQGGSVRRRMLRTGNFEETSTNFDWVDQIGIAEESLPEWALVIERRDVGRFYGVPTALTVAGEVLETDPAEIWSRLPELQAVVNEKLHEIEEIEKGPLHRIAAERREAELDVRRAELEHGEGTAPVEEARREFEAVVADTDERAAEYTQRVRDLREINSRYVLVGTIADGREVEIELSEIVRAVPANHLTAKEKLGVYVDRWKEFLFDEPRKANSQGGIWPALFGTVAMTLIMSFLVVPFGVLAALYLREYAKQGFLVSIVRVAVNNLAGVPSIVFGVFGLGFFCYAVGGTIDDLFFPEYAPNPVYRKGGVLWASLTLALLTLPVVIVATEEALSAVPRSMREGSYACGATKWQTIRRIVLPRAMPGIMTGMVLAIARGAGEVAPLMLVGAVKYSPELAIELSTFPYVFPERSFMHLGFHIFDVGFQSQDSEAAKPMVYTTTLLLIGIVVTLNLVAVGVRTRLRKRFRSAR